MSWRFVATSSIGTSHIQTGDACQDSCLVDVLTAPDTPPLLQMLVADGAGSAKYGGQGAEAAIEAAARFIADHYHSATLSLNETFAADCLQTIRTRLHAEAASMHVSPREYACTFIALFSLPGQTLVMQVGDGGVALTLENANSENNQGNNNDLFLPIIPMSGEYANMTYFVTDEAASDALEIRYYPQTTQKAAVFTDGIQRLALDLQTNTPHQPFFAPFFKTLAHSNQQQEDQLEPALRNFLNSDSINQRTDDDKTLALAVWVT